MNRLVVAALAASCFAVPTTLPASAAPTLTDEQADCLIFPVFKKQCWEQGAAAARKATQSVASATRSAATAASTAITEPRVPVIWKCTPAPKGSGHLLDC